MPFIKHNGVAIHFENLEDAIAYAEKYGGITAAGAQKNSAGQRNGEGGPWTMSLFKDYTGRLSATQIRMLQEVVKSGHQRTAKDLASTLGFSSGAKSFGPILAAMSKHAKKAGVSFDAVMKSDRIDVGDEKMLVFNAAPAFVKIASEAGWKVGE
jgi:hypothetical protein